ncbi:TetR/AcrR family transcriptional regulator [Streptomyces acidiscabies]|uniref:TetR family transcriptional regulator n=1 Tax=Streptomyces acidiscabies TaxID=42234 RepID=A0A0L0KG74_9ACTN|nr:TetR family transcriptional regulator [Streptomyces acidiscabies]KND36574.1 TetR family transcriptional regulator [Streptomyces acidiscabies]
MTSPGTTSRRDLILAAALDVVAEEGAIRVTYRRIAAAAGVPLGSVTYYFDDLNQLLTEAFTRLAETVSAHYRAQLEAARTAEEARDAVVDIMSGTLWTSDRDPLLTFELYAFAARAPELRTVLNSWMRASRDALARHFDPLTARALDALVEGFTLHNFFDDTPIGRDDIAEIVQAVLERGRGFPEGKN